MLPVCAAYSLQKQRAAVRQCCQCIDTPLLPRLSSGFGLEQNRMVVGWVNNPQPKEPHCPACPSMSAAIDVGLRQTFGHLHKQVTSIITCNSAILHKTWQFSTHATGDTRHWQPLTTSQALCSQAPWPYPEVAIVL
jgi:hypothetical protein